MVIRKDLQNVEALSFDPISRLLYWVDAGAQKIEVLPPTHTRTHTYPGQQIHAAEHCNSSFSLSLPLSPLCCQVSNPDGDLRHTLLNSSVLEHPRALVLLPGER